MIIGVPKEIKNNENRVGLIPRQVRLLVREGHTVLIEKNAGVGSGFSNEEYRRCGGKIAFCANVWNAPFIVKVKEPLQKEYRLLKKKQILFTYLHLAGVDPQLTHVLLQKKVTALAYETVERIVDGEKTLPLLAPMSEVAGRMGVQVGSEYLAKYKGGSGVLIDGISNVDAGTVVVIGAGTVGMNAVDVALGRGAHVILLNRSSGKLKEAEVEYKDAVKKKQLKTALASPANIAKYVVIADILIGAVLVPGAKAPVVVSEKFVKEMKKGSVLVDVAIDQGGCIATSHVTTHQDPVFVLHDVIHYCVANMPGAYPRTSTLGLTTATFPYVRKIAAASSSSLLAVLQKDHGLKTGLQCYNGFLTNKRFSI